jgi:hypothetical protein
MSFLFRFSALFLIPLVPAVILWSALERLPEAAASALAYRGMDFSLTGSAAGYVVFVLLGFTAHRIVVTSKAERLLETERRIKKRASQLVGRWSYDEQVQGTDEGGMNRLARTGVVHFSPDSERVLYVQGERFDQNGHVVQRWASERVFLLENELFIHYEVPALNGRAPFDGLARLSIQRESDGSISGMTGSFSALNLARYGVIRLVKAV